MSSKLREENSNLRGDNDTLRDEIMTLKNQISDLKRAEKSQSERPRSPYLAPGRQESVLSGSQNPPESNAG